MSCEWFPVRDNEELRLSDWMVCGWSPRKRKICNQLLVWWWATACDSDPAIKQLWLKDSCSLITGLIQVLWIRVPESAGNPAFHRRFSSKGPLVSGMGTLADCRQSPQTRPHREESERYGFIEILAQTDKTPAGATVSCDRWHFRD